MAREFLLGQMAEYTKGNGIMAESMAKESLELRIKF